MSVTGTVQSIDETTIQDFDLGKCVVTIWKNGGYKVWGTMDAYLARNDPDWLQEVSIEKLLNLAVKDHAIGVLARGEGWGPATEQVVSEG